MLCYAYQDCLYGYKHIHRIDKQMVFLQYESKHGDGHVKKFWKLYDKLGKRIPQHQV